jgi:hypothetical protein
LNVKTFYILNIYGDFLMKKFNIVLIAMFIAFLSGCASTLPTGMIMTNLKLPIATTGVSGQPSKVGEASCTSILSMVAKGDCSIETAKKNGGITQVNHIDWEVDNLLGIWATYKVVVYGD